LQLLVNKTLNEKTLASGFGSVHFLLDASEQQQVRNFLCCAFCAPCGLHWKDEYYWFIIWWSGAQCFWF